MLHTAFFLNQIHFAGSNATGISPSRDTEWMNGGFPNYSMYLCADDRPVFLGPIEPSLFFNFLQAVGKVDLFPLLEKDRAKLKEELKILFKTKDREAWVRDVERGSPSMIFS